MEDTRFELRLSRERRRELAELADRCGLSSADGPAERSSAARYHFGTALVGNVDNIESGLRLEKLGEKLSYASAGIGNQTRTSIRVRHWR
jgi:hypothetical protein